MELNNNNGMIGDFGQSATFNQAVFQQVRINKLMDRINECSINMLATNIQFEEHNYKIIFNDLDSLLGEISSKLTEEEQKEIFHERSILNKYMDMGIYDTRTNVNPTNSSDKKHSKVLNSKRWFLLREGLFNFKIKIINLMEKHGFGNPNKDDPRLASLKR